MRRPRSGVVSQTASTLVARYLHSETSVEAWFRTTTNTGGKIVGFGNQPNRNQQQHRRPAPVLDNVRTGVLRDQAGLEPGSSPAALDSTTASGTTWWERSATTAWSCTSTGRGSTGQQHPYRALVRLLLAYRRRQPQRLAEPAEQRLLHRHDRRGGRLHPRADQPAGDQPLPGHSGGVQNVAPTAAFTSSVSGLSAAFTSTSSDADGSIASYAWEFGDGTTSTQQNPSKTYASAGTYSVRLTVTDNDGASDSVTNPVTVDDGGGQPGTALASDDFARSVANGWGSAPIGGTWSLVGGSTCSTCPAAPGTSG